jgi:hypothetical protein
LPLTRAKLFFACTEKLQVIVVGVNAVQQNAHFLISSKKHHRFNPGKTFDMRKEFLGECKDAERIINTIFQNLEENVKDN